MKQFNQGWSKYLNSQATQTRTAQVYTFPTCLRASPRAPNLLLIVSHWPPTLIFCDRIIFIFAYLQRKNEPNISITMNVTLTNVSVYCTSFLQGRITNADPSSIMFVKFFCEKYPLAMDKYIMIIHAHLYTLCASKALDEKLKINELGA